MDNDWPVLCVWMVVHDVSDSAAKLEQGIGEGVGMTRPLSVVKQNHFPLLVVLEKEPR